MSTVNQENTCSHLVGNETKTPTIQEMFQMQKDLQIFYASRGQAVCPETSTPKERVDEITRQWRNLTLEFAELLERLPFKEWKSYTPEQIQESLSGDNLLETKFEVIDMWHFFMNIALMLGMTGEEFSQLYFLKNKENYDRQSRGY